MMGGLFAWFSARETLHPLGGPLGLFLAIGVLGGFTTFSAFGLDALKLLQSGDYPLAFAYVVASVGLSLLAVVLGFWLVKVLG
jgi:CrcB protein